MASVTCRCGDPDCWREIDREYLGGTWRRIELPWRLDDATWQLWRRRDLRPIVDVRLPD